MIILVLLHISWQGEGVWVLDLTRGRMWFLLVLLEVDLICFLFRQHLMGLLDFLMCIRITNLKDNLVLLVIEKGGCWPYLLQLGPVYICSTKLQLS